MLPRPSPGASAAVLRVASLAPAEVTAELQAAQRAGIEGLLELEPQAPPSLLHAASAAVVDRQMSSGSLESSLQAARLAREQGNCCIEANAASLLAAVSG